MILKRRPGKILVSCEVSRAIDREAQGEWGFNSFSLIEAAGRNCARVFEEAFPEFFARRKESSGPRVCLAAGTGNNGADAMVMLRYWILEGQLDPAACAVVLSRLPNIGESSPWTEILKSLEKMKVPVFAWDEIKRSKADGITHNIFAGADLILDGISGTGLEGPLRGAALEMAEAINALGRMPPGSMPPGRIPADSGSRGAGSASFKKPLVVSVDLPSGLSDSWEPGMSVIEADITLAISPAKYCLYTQAARPKAGTILPVLGIFPDGLTEKCEGIEILSWDDIKGEIPKIPPEAYKNSRGTVEIRAGSKGSAGAAIIAARGAQAAGAGLVRLVVDDDIYPVVAPALRGSMAAPASSESDAFKGRFKPDAILLGPGWGGGEDRLTVMEKALELEKAGIPLILDADAIELAKDRTFNGNVILTPHPGEFSRYTGIKTEELLCRPVPALKKYARERGAYILLKAHVSTIVSPDGRTAVIDGMLPVLAAGGSGDLLAGFCAAIAARMAKSGSGFDAFSCAAAACSLLFASARCFMNRFTDPMEIADKAADIAGLAWLGGFPPFQVDAGNVTGGSRNGR